MLIKAQSNNPNVNQGNSPIALDDLLKYPELAQRIASVNQVALGYLQNALVQATMEEQQESIKGATSSGFGSAASTAVIGAVEGLGGGLNGAGSVFQVRAAVETTGEITKETAKAETALDEFRKTGTQESITLQGGDATTPAATPTGASGTITAENQTAAATESRPKARTIKEIVSEKEGKIEEYKSRNSEATNRANLFQNAGQISQLYSQGIGPSSSKVWDTNQQMMNSTSSTAQSTTQSANQVVQTIAQLDPYRQNIRS